MNFFIDESGRFEAHEDATSKKNYECVTGIFLTDELLAVLESLYGDKDKLWLRTHPKEVIELLILHNAKAFVVVYDADQFTAATVEKWKKDYINSIFEGNNHPDFMKESINKHVKILTQTSLEQFTKALFAIMLMENMLRGILCQSNEYDENSFKDFPIICDEITSLIEPTLKYFVSYAVHCNSTTKPLILDNPTKVAHLIHSEGKYFNGQRFFEKVNFTKSKDSTGVRVADVIANQVYRLFRGNPRDYDIALLSKLFSNPYSLRFVHLDIDQEFIEAQVDSDVKKWVDGMPEQVNL